MWIEIKRRKSRLLMIFTLGFFLLGNNEEGLMEPGMAFTIEVGYLVPF